MRKTICTIGVLVLLAILTTSTLPAAPTPQPPPIGGGGGCNFNQCMDACEAWFGGASCQTGICGAGPLTSCKVGCVVYCKVGEWDSEVVR